MPDKHSGGRPPIYKTKEEIEEKIEQYFESCKGHPLTDDKGKTIYNKWGHPVIVDKKPPTITGLALAIGFASRQALLNYQSREEFNDTITRAKSRIEQYAEERLFDRDGVNGAKFSLQNNFKGWSENPEQKPEEREDDGFLEALNGTAGEDWNENGDL